MPLKTQHEELPAINLTPMIDVLLFLIIFFLAVTTLSRGDRSMKVHVPEVSDASALSDRPAPQVVNVFQDGRIEFNREMVSLTELVSRLSASRGQYPDLEVDVRGDGHAYHQHVAEVVSACMQAGIERVGISVQSKSRR